MMLLSTLLLAGTCVSTKVGWLGDIEDDTYAVFMHAAQRYDVTPHFCETAAACGDLDGLRGIVTPLIRLGRLVADAVGRVVAGWLQVIAASSHHIN